MPPLAGNGAVAQRLGQAGKRKAIPDQSGLAEYSEKQAANYYEWRRYFTNTQGAAVRRNITLALAVVVTLSGSEIALSNCSNSFSTNDAFTEGLSSGVVGDQFDPTTSFAGNKTLDAYATAFANFPSCIVGFNTNNFTPVSTDTVVSIQLMKTVTRS